MDLLELSVGIILSVLSANGGKVAMWIDEYESYRCAVSGEEMGECHVGRSEATTTMRTWLNPCERNELNCKEWN